MGCNRYAHDTGAMSQTSDDMHSQTGPRVYVEEYAKMRHSNSTTLPLNFEHLMHHDDVLQKVISGQFLRYPSPYWVTCLSGDSFKNYSAIQHALLARQQTSAWEIPLKKRR